MSLSIETASRIAIIAPLGLRVKSPLVDNHPSLPSSRLDSLIFMHAQARIRQGDDPLFADPQDRLDEWKATIDIYGLQMAGRAYDRAGLNPRVLPSPTAETRRSLALVTSLAHYLIANSEQISRHDLLNLTRTSLLKPSALPVNSSDAEVSFVCTNTVSVMNLVQQRRLSRKNHMSSPVFSFMNHLYDSSRLKTEEKALELSLQTLQITAELPHVDIEVSNQRLELISTMHQLQRTEAVLKRK